MGENGWKWAKMGENWVKIGENWKFHFYEFLVIFCNFGWFQAILVHFVQFVKGVVQFLKGDGQLVKGADRLKLLSKLAVFPLLLISFTTNYWKKRFPGGKRANGPKKGERANGQTKSNARKRVRAKLQIWNRRPGSICTDALDLDERRIPITEQGMAVCSSVGT